MSVIRIHHGDWKMSACLYINKLICIKVLIQIHQMAFTFVFTYTMRTYLVCSKVKIGIHALSFTHSEGRENIFISIGDQIAKADNSKFALVKRSEKLFIFGYYLLKHLAYQIQNIKLICQIKKS